MMGNKKFYSLSLLVTVLLITVLLLGCKAAPSPTPTPTTPAAAPKPAPAPTSTPTPAASPKPAPTTSAAAQPFYKGKTITFVVPSAAGAGQDLSARVWAKHLPRFIPGSPNIIVNNMPGAGQLIGSNYTYNAKPDGTTGMVGGGGSYMGSLFKLPEAKYDYRKMTVVIANISGVVYVTKTGIVDTPYDITKSSKWIFGATPTGFPIWFFAVANEIMPVPTEKVLAVYSGSAASRMALFSGEINISAESSTSYKTAVVPFVQKGELMALFSTGVIDATGKIARDPLTPEVPTFAEIAERVTGKPIASGKALEAMKAIMGGFSFMHHLLLPPGVPDETVKTLWDASTQMIKDPAYQKEAQSIGSVPPYVWAGETAAKGFRSQFGMADETMKWIMDLAWEKYRVKPAG